MPRPPKKPAAKAARARERTSIMLASELLRQIDEIAAGEERTRSKVIEFACREYVQNHQRRSAAA